MAKKKSAKPRLVFIFFLAAMIFLVWKFFNSGDSDGVYDAINTGGANKESNALICDAIDIPGYQIAQVDGRALDVKADIDQDGRQERVIMYQDANQGGIRYKPVILKIFSDDGGCAKEEFSYIGNIEEQNENEIGDLQILPDFWENGRQAVMLWAVQTAYGSGSSNFLHFFAYENGKYIRVDGPEFSNLGGYKLNGGVVAGKEIIAADFVWSAGEAHFDPHYYKVSIYEFDGSKYIVQKTVTTQNKYTGDIDEMIKKEPDLLSAVD